MLRVIKLLVSYNKTIKNIKVIKILTIINICSIFASNQGVFVNEQPCQFNLGTLDMIDEIEVKH